MSYNHRPILATAVKAIKELNDQNDLLKDKVINLENENNNLKSRLNNIEEKLKNLGIL